MEEVSREVATPWYELYRHNLRLASERTGIPMMNIVSAFDKAVFRQRGACGNFTLSELEVYLGALSDIVRPLDLKRANFTLPILTSEQHSGTDGRRSAFSRAMELVDDLVQSILVGRNGDLRFREEGSAVLDRSSRIQLWNAFMYGGVVNIPDICSNGPISMNIHNAVMEAEDLCDIAMVITPYLMPENSQGFEDDTMVNMVNFNRKRLRHL